MKKTKKQAKTPLKSAFARINSAIGKDLDDIVAEIEKHGKIKKKVLGESKKKRVLAEV